MKKIRHNLPKQHLMQGLTHFYKCQFVHSQLTDLKFNLQPVLNPDTWSKDFVLINRWKAKRFERIQRGDIVSIV